MIEERRFDPADIPSEEAERLQRALSSHARPALVTEGGDVKELPEALNRLFVEILGLMRHRQAIFLIHEDEAYTTQAAANFLGVSRQYVVKLLEEGRIPFHRVGTHRRIFFKDLAAFRTERSKARRAKLDELTREATEAGYDDEYTDLSRRDPV